MGVGCIFYDRGNVRLRAIFRLDSVVMGFSQSLLQQTIIIRTTLYAHPCEREISAHIYVRYEKDNVKTVSTPLHLRNLLYSIFILQLPSC